MSEGRGAIMEEHVPFLFQGGDITERKEGLHGGGVLENKRDIHYRISKKKNDHF